MDSQTTDMDTDTDVAMLDVSQAMFFAPIDAAIESMSALFPANPTIGPFSRYRMPGTGPTGPSPLRCTLSASSAPKQYPHVVVKGPGTEKKCPVCLENILKKDSMHMLKCAHRFHPGCIGPWLAKNATCPVCHVCVS